MAREVVVTGLGIVSSVGETVEAHLSALEPGFVPNVDTTTFAPYPVHPAVHLDWDKQIDECRPFFLGILLRQRSLVGL